MTTFCLDYGLATVQKRIASCPNVTCRYLGQLAKWRKEKNPSGVVSGEFENHCVDVMKYATFFFSHSWIPRAL